MGRETNIHLIRTLEKQIREGKGDIIKLKRARNSLLNISTHVPPEILGHIFVLNHVREVDHSLEALSHFTGLQKGSYNFLLVCHHWFEVASRTPELWSFWGNTLQDWKKRHRRPGATPLDLVLDGDDSDPTVLFDESLQDAVRGHVMQDTIRQVHLKTDYSHTLTSIISSLIPGDEGGQNENIESIVWQNGLGPSVDISNFFTRSRLSGLRLLDLFGNFLVSSWDFLGPQVTNLTALSLGISTFQPSPTLTTPQLLSVLASNPNIQELTLSNTALPNDIDISTFTVQLHDLKSLSLTGEFRHLFGLLRRLTLPEKLDDLHLNGFNPTEEDTLQTLAPYMQDYFRRDPRYQSKLWIYFYSFHTSVSISVEISCAQTAGPLPRASIHVSLADVPSPDILKRLFINLITLVPPERVASLGIEGDTGPPEELFCMVPNIETLHITNSQFSEGFLQPNPDGLHANTNVFPSLQSLRLEYVTFLDGEDWAHLTRYLAHQTSGGRTISLEMIGTSPRMRPEVVNRIKGLVLFIVKGRGKRMSNSVLVFVSPVAVDCSHRGHLQQMAVVNKLEGFTL